MSWKEHLTNLVCVECGEGFSEYYRIKWLENKPYHPSCFHKVMAIREQEEEHERNLAHQG